MGGSIGRSWFKCQYLTSGASVEKNCSALRGSGSGEPVTFRSFVGRRNYAVHTLSREATQAVRLGCLLSEVAVGVEVQKADAAKERRFRSLVSPAVARVAELKLTGSLQASTPHVFPHSLATN
jgi:hypothetical protein